MEHIEFVHRALQHLPTTPPTSFVFHQWSYSGRPTDEGLGLLPIPALDPATIMAAIMDIDHYVGNIDHVTICHSNSDPRFSAPDHVRFYQKIELPILGALHHELVLHRIDDSAGYQVAAWHLLEAETEALSRRDGIRSDYNNGAWFVGPGVLGYALGSAPKRGDVGFMKWKALTRGADAAAARACRANIEGMARWAARR